MISKSSFKKVLMKSHTAQSTGRSLSSLQTHQAEVVWVNWEKNKLPTYRLTQRYKQTTAWL